jgi:hypothetical protein
MRHATALLQTLAATLWVTTLITAFTGFDDEPAVFSPLDQRIWLCALAAAVIATMAAIQHALATKAARTYTAMTKAAVTRPPYAAPQSGPLAQLLATGPLAKLIPFSGTANGRHANQARENA